MSCLDVPVQVVSELKFAVTEITREREVGLMDQFLVEHQSCIGPKLSRACFTDSNKSRRIMDVFLVFLQDPFVGELLRTLLAFKPVFVARCMHLIHMNEEAISISVRFFTFRTFKFPIDDFSLMYFLIIISLFIVTGFFCMLSHMLEEVLSINKHVAHFTFKNLLWMHLP